MDINENNFVTTAAAVMGEFQRTQVVPEIDAYRISKLATETIAANKAGMVVKGYTPGAASTSALRKLKEGIKRVGNHTVSMMHRNRFMIPSTASDCAG